MLWRNIRLINACAEDRQGTVSARVCAGRDRLPNLIATILSPHPQHRRILDRQQFRYRRPASKNIRQLRFPPLGPATTTAKSTKHLRLITDAHFPSFTPSPPADQEQYRYRKQSMEVMKTENYPERESQSAPARGRGSPSDLKAPLSEPVSVQTRGTPPQWGRKAEPFRQAWPLIDFTSCLLEQDLLADVRYLSSSPRAIASFETSAMDPFIERPAPQLINCAVRASHAFPLHRD